MTFKRATEGNNKGVEEVQKANDPLKQKICMMRLSMQKRLKQKALDTGQSESEIMRNALEAVL